MELSEKKKFYHLIIIGLPGLAAWLNPPTLKIVLYFVRFLGSSALVNGISGSNMSLGCAVILLVWLAAAQKKRG